MPSERSRQLVHLSGLLFVLLAQEAGRALGAFLFLMLALTFLYYSEDVRRQERRLWLIQKLEAQLRKIAFGMERPAIARPFLGALWFYTGCFLAFLLYPLPIASAAAAVLAVGDSCSTLAGLHVGRVRIVGRKTLEGSAAFFLGGTAVGLLFLPLPEAVLAAAAGAVAELLPDASLFRSVKARGWLDDNWLIPVLVGAALLLVP